jgi:hypothetical protein
MVRIWFHSIPAGRHEAYYKSKGHQTVQDPVTKKEFTFIPDELIGIEVAHKVNVSNPTLTNFADTISSILRLTAIVCLLKRNCAQSNVGRTALRNTPYGFWSVLRSSSLCWPLRIPSRPLNEPILHLPSAYPQSRIGKSCGPPGTSLPSA